jgi:hypothetical protein
MTEATVSTDVANDRQRIGNPPIYTATDMLDVVLAAYERGRLDAIADLNRNNFNSPDYAAPLRNARRATEVALMRGSADLRYEQRGLPKGYQYRGGPVDWDTGMPQGSGCAWLRRKRQHYPRAAA